MFGQWWLWRFWMKFFFFSKTDILTPRMAKMSKCKFLDASWMSVNMQRAPYVNIQDWPPGKGSALKTVAVYLNVCCQTSACNSETIIHQLTASEDAGRKARATLMLGSKMDAGVEMLRPHQTPLWMKISVLMSAVETKTWSAGGGLEWMSLRQVREESKKSKSWENEHFNKLLFPKKVLDLVVSDLFIFVAGGYFLMGSARCPIVLRIF